MIIDTTKLIPTRKVSASAVGAFAAQALFWELETYQHIVVPDDIKVAATTIIVFAAGWLIKESKKWTHQGNVKKALPILSTYTASGLTGTIDIVPAVGSVIPVQQPTNGIDPAVSQSARPF